MATLILLWGQFFKNILLCDIFKNFPIPSFPSFPVIPQWLIPSFCHWLVSPWTIPITELLARIKQPHKSSRVRLEKWQSSQARDGLILKENKSKTHRFHTLTTSQRRVSHPLKQFYFFSLSFFQVKLLAMLTEIGKHKPEKSLNYNQLLLGLEVLWAFTMIQSSHFWGEKERERTSVIIKRGDDTPSFISNNVWLLSPDPHFPIPEGMEKGVYASKPW